MSGTKHDELGNLPAGQPAQRLDPVVLAKGGDRWADQLAGWVAGVVADWGITIGAQLHGGTSAFVAGVVTASGQPAVLKIAVPGVDVEREIATLVAAGGRGYVTVIAADPARRAMLLEPLGVGLQRSGLSPSRQLAVLASLLPVAWQVSNDGQRPQDKAGQLIEFISDLRDRRHTRIIDEALRCAERRSTAFHPDRCVVVHGDPAAANVLRRHGDGWVFVDPDGFVGDPAYDRGVAARDWCSELLAAANPGRLLQSYCLTLGGDPDVTWEWAFIERVSTGLYLQSLGGDGSPHLTSAAALLADS